MSYWRFPFENELPINCFFTQWKNEHTYWILNLENEMHSIRIIWTNGFQECKGKFYFSKTDGTYNNFWLGFEKHRFFLLGLPKGAGLWGPSPYPPPLKVCRENRKCHSMCAWTRQDMKQYHVDLFKHVRNSQTQCRKIMYSHWVRISTNYRYVGRRESYSRGRFPKISVTHGGYSGVGNKAQPWALWCPCIIR
jgi:hypothetical protein